MFLLSVGLRKRTLESIWQPESRSVSMTTGYRKRFVFVVEPYHNSSVI
jgi:hypothetical protein